MCINKNINTSWLRRPKADALSQAYSVNIVKRDTLIVEKYDYAIISPIFFNQGRLTGGVIDENGTPVTLSKINVFSSVDRKPGKYIDSDEIAVYCGGCWGYPFHWGHFLLDVVPRLWYALSENGKTDVTYIILGLEGKADCNLDGNFLAFLKLLGIEKRVRVLSRTTRFRRVLIPEKSYEYAPCVRKNGIKNYYSDAFLCTFDFVIRNALKEMENYSTKEKSKKIYMARKADRDSGIELIENLFQNNGFDIINPVEIPLIELIQWLHTCDTVAYISGTLQHNLLFAPLGLKAIAIERRAWISPVQIDIDIIKEIHVDYVEASYSIVPDETAFLGLYGYTKQLKCYIENFKWNLPNREFLTKEYCEASIKKYMGNYDLSAFGGLREIFDEYIFGEYQLSVEELEGFLGDRIQVCRDDFSDIERARKIVKQILINLRTCYRKWDDGEWRVACESLSGILRYVFRKSTPHRFFLYPFGKNGMLLKQILNEQYGIDNVIVFDNQLSKINKDIKPLQEINKYDLFDGCVILTSAIRECWDELSVYVDLMNVEGPFSVY